MKREINKFVKTYNPTIILRNKVIGDLIKICLIDWIDNQGLYCSFFVVYNASQILAKEQIKIGKYNDGISLEKNVRVFDNKEDWVKGKWEIEDAVEIQEEIQKALNSLKEFKFENYGYSIFQISYILNPVVMLIIGIEADERYVTSITIVQNQITLIKCRSSSYFYFLQELFDILGLEELVQLEKDYE